MMKGGAEICSQRGVTPKSKSGTVVVVYLVLYVVAILPQTRRCKTSSSDSRERKITLDV